MRKAQENELAELEKLLAEAKAAGAPDETIARYRQQVEALKAGKPTPVLGVRGAKIRKI